MLTPTKEACRDQGNERLCHTEDAIGMHQHNKIDPAKKLNDANEEAPGAMKHDKNE